MPIPQTVRVNPLDLQGNIAIGVSLPFNGPAGPFNKTYSTADQIKSNLVNLLLTNKGERVFNLLAFELQNNCWLCSTSDRQDSNQACKFCDFN